jgi:hypothetical protein
MQYHIGDTGKIGMGTDGQSVRTRAKGTIHEILRIIHPAGRESYATRQGQAPMLGFQILIPEPYPEVSNAIIRPGFEPFEAEPGTVYSPIAIDVQALPEQSLDVLRRQRLRTWNGQGCQRVQGNIFAHRRARCV